MLIPQHKNARTTPSVRTEIAASNETASVLAQRFGITEQTVYKGKKREVFADRSYIGEPDKQAIWRNLGGLSHCRCAGQSGGLSSHAVAGA